MKKRYLEDMLIALSLANLLFVLSWRRLIFPNTDFYHVKFPPEYIDYLSVMLLTLLVAGCFWGGLWMLRKLIPEKAHIFARLIFLLVLVCIANSVRMAFPEQQLWLMETFGVKPLLIFFGGVGAVGLYLSLRYWDKSFEILRLAVLVLSPFVLVTFLNSVIGIANADNKPEESIAFSSTDKTRAAKSNIKSRVIWIIFDGMDYKAAFESRPEDVKMPEFDRLKSQSLTATHAKPPGYETLLAIPSLLVGKRLEQATPEGKDDLSLGFEGRVERVNLSKADTIFSDVRRLGGSAGVVGWYHAYCRVFRSKLSACHWESFDFGNDFKSRSFAQSLQRDLYNLLISVPLAVRYFKSYKGKDYVERYERLSDATHKILENPEIDLAFIHRAVPHEPYQYSRTQKKFTGSGNYLDNLALTDEVLGDIRQNLESAGLWEESTVVISADHQWRLKALKFRLTEEEYDLTNGVEDARVPFIIKLRNQNEPLVYDIPLDTIITRKLIVEIMKGKVSTPAELKIWLDQHSNGSS